MLLCGTQLAIAQGGTFDPAFGASGISTPFGNTIAYVRSMALQADGRIVISGSVNNDFFVARLMPDGRTDETFGGTGMVVTDVGPGDEGWDVTIMPNGRIVASGESNHAFVAIGYQHDGTLDPSFGEAGVAFTTLSGGQDGARAAAFQSDGKLTLAGTASGSFALVRYLSDGSLDAAFGTGGKVMTGMPASAGMIRAVQIQNDGRLVAAGTGDGHVLLARYEPNGALDSTFGDQGIVALKFDPNGGALDLKLQQDNRIVVSGYIGNELALLRFAADGELDNSFSSTLNFGTYSADGNALAIQPDGKILVVGEYNSAAFIVRYDMRGVLDANFATDGIGMMESAGSDGATAVLLQKDGNILVAGRKANHPFVVRLIGDSPEPNTAGVLAFESAAMLPNGTFSCALRASPGRQYVIEVSSSFGPPRWNAVQSNMVPQDGVIQFNDPLASAKGAQFYRGLLR